jgi:hypothetical protein
VVVSNQPYAAAKAEELCAKHGWFLCSQFENEANPNYHAQTTGRAVAQNGCTERLCRTVVQNGCAERLHRTVVQNGCTERLYRTVASLHSPGGCHSISFTDHTGSLAVID